MTPEQRGCIVCARRLDNTPFDVVQPYGGTAFSSRGHYGSTVYDPMNGAMIEVVVCDACLVRAKADGRVYGAVDEIGDEPAEWTKMALDPTS